MGGTWRDRLKNLFDVRGLGWQVLIPVVIIAAGAVGVGTIVFWKSVRDALSDFLTTDLEVWHLLLVVGAEAIIGGVAVFLVRPSIRSSGGKGTALYPVEVQHFGVLWPITHPRGGGLQVGKPMCPRDRSTLGYFVNNKLVSFLSDWDESLVASAMNFACPREGCGGAYDLTGHKYHMMDLVQQVHDVAMGEWRAASAAARAAEERT